MGGCVIEDVLPGVDVVPWPTVPWVLVPDPKSCIVEQVPEISLGSQGEALWLQPVDVPASRIAAAARYVFMAISCLPRARNISDATTLGKCRPARVVSSARAGRGVLTACSPDVPVSRR
jgi:hypothetical protein